MRRSELEDGDWMQCTPSPLAASLELNLSLGDKRPRESHCRCDTRDIEADGESRRKENTNAQQGHALLTSYALR